MSEKSRPIQDHSAKGGKARAKSLTSEQRSEIARAAVQERWRKAGKLRDIRVATHGSEDHPLKVGEIEIPCYVLDDGTRVVSHRGLQRSIGMAESGGAQRLSLIVEVLSAKGIDTKGLASRISPPIEFRRPRGGIAFGYEATVLADLCDILLAARNDGILSVQQMRWAEQAEILLRGFARVGIIALVDEATGYQQDRARDALAKILEAFIAKELRQWVKTFPVDYYKELYRLRGRQFPPKSNRMPRYFGVLTNDIVYARLAPAVLDELKERNPVGESGYRKTRHHQWLTEQIGHPKLLQHLSAVVALMKASNNYDGFRGLLDRALPKQMALPLFEQPTDQPKGENKTD